MIPRYQKILFAVLLVAALVMGSVLWRLRQREHQRLLAGEDSAPTKAPEIAPEEQATLVVANDMDGSLQMQGHSYPLPRDPEAKARVVLNKLLELYAAPGAAHPVAGSGAGVAQVFLLPAPDVKRNPGAKLAVVNLTGNFAASHPSGLESETLTVLSICATLRANLPSVAEVRFLVDGQERSNLAGHADLTRTYVTAYVEPVGGSTP